MTNSNTKIPLFVDLDGTYTKADLLLESFVLAIKKNPLIILNCFFWLVQGKQKLKFELANVVKININELPLNLEFLEYLKEQKKLNRKIFLATAATSKYAQQFIDSSNIFDGFLSSDKNINLSGKNKLNKIKEMYEQFGYAGNDKIDFEIFKAAKQKILVNPTSRAIKESNNTPVDMIFDNHQVSIKDWVKQLRIYQWLKNLLLFVPLFVSGQFTDISALFMVVASYFSFSLIASATYVLNDLFDLSSDRCHPRKRFRPLASSKIGIYAGIKMSLLLFTVSVITAAGIGLDFLVVLMLYLFLTLSYSFKIKQYIGMDVVALALLYTIRIFAGAAAIGVFTSFWLLAFSIFIFLSLALIKRCSEIKSLHSSGKDRAEGRDYNVDDYAILTSFGTSSALLSVLMFCFYINNNVLNSQYHKPDMLWLIVPALCYWLMRMWIKTHRSEMHDDPIIFSLKDKGSLVTIGFCGLITIVAQIL